MSPSTSTASSIHIFGIRHHGPGSARSLKQALAALRPDVVLVEGPPDAEAVLPLLAHAEMQAPVALLIYAPEQPQQAVYYPFAEFSPEWQAIHYALSHQVPVRFMDLPQTHQIMLDAAEPAPPEGAPSESTPDATVPSTALPETDPQPCQEPAAFDPRLDPLRWLAEAAGYNDSERWWEDMVEHRGDSTDLFEAVLEAMTALRAEVERFERERFEREHFEREHFENDDSSHETEESKAEERGKPHANGQRESQREAWMRQTIRAAQREGFARIAVVCGAWHGPALLGTLPEPQQEATDAGRLRDLPRTRVQATWVPWTYGRLCLASGYGAGIESPGWYHHLWTAPDQPGVRWMARVAALLREQDLDTSSAHVIEAVRLAESLAALRARPLPGLAEFNEATLSILCAGNSAPLRLIHEKIDRRRSAGFGSR